MKRISWILLLAALVAFPILGIAAAGDPVEVVDLKLATGIEDRAPVGTADAFDVGAKVYTWIKLRVREAESTIKVRYSVDGVVTFTSDPITVRQSMGWRTWMWKSFHKAGAWKVEVLDAQGTPIYDSSFTVK